MKKALIIFIVIVLAGVGLVTIINQNSQDSSQSVPVSQMGEEKNNMKLESSQFKGYTMIPSKYTCDGENVSPPLQISGVPKDAKSLVLVVDDPDAPNGTWTHWTMWNIDPKTTQIPENSIPGGVVQGNTSFGKPGYGGACPPSGQHRYFFKLFALDNLLNLNSSSSVQDLEKAIEGHVLATTELVGFYARK